MGKSNSTLTKPAFLILFVLLITGYNAHAQFNDTTHYHATLSSTGSINRTQDGNSFLLTNVLDFGMKRKDYSMNLNGNYVYGKQDNTLTNRDYNTLFNANLFRYTPFPHSFYWVLVSYNTSVSLKINNETEGGFGFAYSVIDSKNAYLNFSDGVLYDQSDLMVHDTIRDVYHTYRNSFRLMFHFAVKDILVLDGSNFLQNSFQRGSDYIIRSNTSLTFKLRKWIGLTTSLVYNKMNNTDSENLLFTYGLTIDKYF
jgi:hypothetical protein